MSLKNIEKYSQERQRRWQMAREGEPRAVQSACTALEQILGTPCAYTRYDGLWFEAFDPQEPGNGWVRGAPDYLIRFNRRYIYAEIKLKSVMFHMTLTGGQMSDGTVIPCYGCESLYLDKEPVYRNMRAFARAVGVAPGSFLLLFACPDGIRAISLAEIDALVENGFRGAALGLISDGYGTAVEGGQLSAAGGCHPPSRRRKRLLLHPSHRAGAGQAPPGLLLQSLVLPLGQAVQIHCHKG